MINDICVRFFVFDDFMENYELTFEIILDPLDRVFEKIFYCRYTILITNMK